MFLSTLFSETLYGVVQDRGLFYVIVNFDITWFTKCLLIHNYGMVPLHHTEVVDFCLRKG